MRAHVRSSSPGYLVVLIIAALAAAGGDVARGHAATVSVTGTFELRATLDLVSNLIDCPAGVSATVCATRTGGGVVPGLGSVSESYTFLADIGSAPCAPGYGKALGYPVAFVVEGKGEIHFTLAEGPACLGEEAVRTQTQAFTITGGTGIFGNASGTGAVERVLGAATSTGRAGFETWKGTLVVPGLEFDVTAPTLSGAVGKTVRAPRGAKSVRVRFTVTANDDVDGALVPTCKPRSGSPFKLGKTRVTCSATDTSGNTSTAKFTVTVKARR